MTVEELIRDLQRLPPKSVVGRLALNGLGALTLYPFDSVFRIPAKKDGEWDAYTPHQFGEDTVMLHAISDDFAYHDALKVAEENRLKEDHGS